MKHVFKLNKKGQENKLIFNNVIFLLFVVAFLIIMVAFVETKISSASVWGELYAKEISKVINYAKAGDEITLDVHKGAAIAYKNKISESDIFAFDNLNKQICINLDGKSKYCYSYFNNVDITDVKISWGEPVNQLSFKVKESAK